MRAGRQKKHVWALRLKSCEREATLKGVSKRYTPDRVAKRDGITQGVAKLDTPAGGLQNGDPHSGNYLKP